MPGTVPGLVGAVESIMTLPSSDCVDPDVDQRVPAIDVAPQDNAGVENAAREVQDYVRPDRAASGPGPPWPPPERESRQNG